MPTGLYGWIHSNDGRSIGLFIGFLLCIQVIAPLAVVVPLIMVDLDHAPFFAWNGYLTRYAPLVLFGSIVWFAAQLWWHVETVKRAIGFHFIDADDEPRLCRLVEPLIILAGLPPPYIGVIECDRRNAFACGIGRRKAVIVLTRGLLDTLSEAELEAVLAHELSHIRHGDIRLMAAANIFMGTLTRLHARNRLRFTPVHGLLAIAIPAVLPLSLAASILGRLVLKAGQASRLTLASSREFIADAQAAEWTRNPGALASALLKVENHYRVDARTEDDAMMIVGDSEGSHATHPTIAERIAALARVTGSMVFNAPDAPRDSDWSLTTTRSAVSRTAFGRRAITTQVMTRVRQGDDQNFLGLTFIGTLALLMTAGALLGLHWDTLSNRRALVTTFSLRPVATMIGAPVACELSPFFAAAKVRCAASLTAGAYREFEDEQATLAGFLARQSRQRRLRGITNADLSMTSFGTDQFRETYRGQSGRMSPIVIRRDEDGLYLGKDGRFTHGRPPELIVAETDRLGCFVRDPRPIERNGPIPLSENDSVSQLAGIRSDLVHLAQEISTQPADRAALTYYLDRRETLVDEAYALYGRPGLEAIKSLLGNNTQGPALAHVRQAATSDVVAGLSIIDQSKLRSLLRNPDAFVPCRSLTLGGTG